jgi:hypothetical protein
MVYCFVHIYHWLEQRKTSRFLLLNWQVKNEILLMLFEFILVKSGYSPKKIRIRIKSCSSSLCIHYCSSFLLCLGFITNCFSYYIVGFVCFFFLKKWFSSSDFDHHVDVVHFVYIVMNRIILFIIPFEIWFHKLKIKS